VYWDLYQRPQWVRERCFLIKCCKRRLNQRSFVLLYLCCLLFDLCLVCVQFLYCFVCQYQSSDWLWRPPPKWPRLCQMERYTLLQSVTTVLTLIAISWPYVAANDGVYRRCCVCRWIVQWHVDLCKSDSDEVVTVQSSWPPVSGRDGGELIQAVVLGRVNPLTPTVAIWLQL